jgi:hypothetical protein
MPCFPRACLLNRTLPRESNPDVSSWWIFEPDSASSHLHSFYQMFSRPSIREIHIRWGRPGVSNPTNDRSTSCLILHTFLLGTFGRPLARDAEVGLNAEERRGFSSRLTCFTPTHPVSLFSAPGFLLAMNLVGGKISSHSRTCRTADVLAWKLVRVSMVGLCRTSAQQIRVGRP